jgi:hypothetical protein
MPHMFNDRARNPADIHYCISAISRRPSQGESRIVVGEIIVQHGDDTIDKGLLDGRLNERRQDCLARRRRRNAPVCPALEAAGAVALGPAGG